MNENIPGTVVANVTKTTNVIIRPKSSTTHLPKPLVAVNWFSTKTAWIYHLYNTLAGIQVKKVAGKGIFKGKIMETLWGDSQLEREFLLIVQYPTALQFKKLMENSFFKLVSVLRVIAVKDFTFGFFDIKTKEELPQKNAYAVHHFTYAQQDGATEALDHLLKQNKVSLFFKGEIAANLIVQKQDEPEKQAPCIMDGVCVFSAMETSVLHHFLCSESFQNYQKQFKTTYVGMLERML